MRVVHSSTWPLVILGKAANSFSKIRVGLGTIQSRVAILKRIAKILQFSGKKNEERVLNLQYLPGWGGHFYKSIIRIWLCRGIEVQLHLFLQTIGPKDVPGVCKRLVNWLALRTSY